MSPTVKKFNSGSHVIHRYFISVVPLKSGTITHFFFFLTFMGLTVFELIYKLSLSLSNVPQGLDSSCASSRAGIPS